MNNQCIEQYIKETESQGITERDEQGSPYKFLANYYLKRDELDDAYDYAMKCTQLTDVLEETNINFVV